MPVWRLGRDMTLRITLDSLQRPIYQMPHEVSRYPARPKDSIGANVSDCSTSGNIGVVAGSRLGWVHATPPASNLRLTLTAKGVNGGADQVKT